MTRRLLAVLALLATAAMLATGTAATTAVADGPGDFVWNDCPWEAQPDGTCRP